MIRSQQSDDGFVTRCVSRKEFLKQVAVASGFFFAACSPLRVVFKAYPRKFEEDTALCDCVLRAFVTTVIPGAGSDEPNLARMFTDDYYPFHSFSGFFVADLSERSADLFGNERFDQLSLAQRTKVVEDGLNADATVQRLYRGAILIAQVSYYPGIYDDTKGCPLIDFHGANYGFTADEMYYPNYQALLAREATANGNYS